MMPDVLYLDNHLLVVNKAAGLLAQADETGDVDVLTFYRAFLKRKFNKPGNVFLGLVHRLDRPVSGAMVLARTSKAAARLTSQFKQHQVKKRYAAIIEGHLAEDQAEWHDYLVKKDRVVTVVRAGHPLAKSAKLSWRVVFRGQETSLVEVDLHTGRPHQIRVQFATRGYPLLGDLRYGATRPFDQVNLALHCHYLEITHPVKTERLAWSAPFPISWTGFFDEERAALLDSSGE